MAASRRPPLLVALRPLGLGDLLTGVPALRALAHAFPAHERVLAAPAMLAPLAVHAGVADRVVPTEPLVPLDRSLHEADVAVDLHGRGPASHRVLLAARPRRLIAFANAEVPESAGMPAWRQDEHEVARWCRLLAESGIPADPADFEIGAPPRAVPDAAHAATLIHAGAASAARRWPADRFAAVARSELAAGRRVVFTGAPHERALAASVARLAGAPDSAVLAGKTDLMELAALVAAAARVVCGDTGVAHLATALGTPSVVLFGPTPPAWWGPPPNRAQHRILWAGRKGDPHGVVPDPGLLAIEVDEVFDALASIERVEVAA